MGKLPSDFDVVISFAGADRELAATINAELKRAGVRTFYDDDHQTALWGANAAEVLSDIYSQRGRYCLMIISKEYLRNMWTRLERRAAISRLIRGEGEYVLPYFIDETPPDSIPGLSPDIVYLSAAKVDTLSLVQHLLEKLATPEDLLRSMMVEWFCLFAVEELYRRECGASEEPRYHWIVNAEYLRRNPGLSDRYARYEIGHRSWPLLEKLELVEAEPFDRAGTEYHLTAKGRRVAQDMLEGKVTSLSEIVGPNVS